MKPLSALSFVFAPFLLSCAVEETAEEAAHSPAESASVAAVGGDGGKCAPDFCGMNSPELSDGFFHEMNLDGRANAEGYSFTTVRKGGAYYKLDVIAGRITGRLIGGLPGSVPTLSGIALNGVEATIKRVHPETGEVTYRTLVFDGYTRTTDFWAKLSGGSPATPIETYRFKLVYPSGITTYLCRNGAEFVDPSASVRAMPEHHALVFEGERIDVETLTISPAIDPQWVNFGCAETALAKMHLTGHTRAAQLAGFDTTIGERQTMLKMLTADYCGLGIPFTVAGQRVRWTDDRGSLTVAPTETKVMEARWSVNGATCLNVPRVDAHPTEASREVFPNGVAALIARTCLSQLPACAPVAPVHHLVSWNPTPFTLPPR